MILTHPNEQLRRRSTEIDPARFGSTELTQLADHLVRHMETSDGVGIAAPQIGVPERFIVVHLPHTGPTAFCNPRIVRASSALMEFEEGCLSVPGVYGIVMRHKRVTVEAFALNGERVELNLKGLHAVVFQHEIDHLDGVLFIDKVVRLTAGALT